MFRFRKCPFEDPLEFMVSVVAKEAEAEGKPLTDEEKQKLREDGRSRPVDEFEVRIKRLVRQIVDREAREGVAEAPVSFNGAIEWAGDADYPFVVQIAEGVYCLEPDLQPPLRGRQRVIDVLQCVGCAVLLILLLMVASGIFVLLNTLWGNK